MKEIYHKYEKDGYVDKDDYNRFTDLNNGKENIKILNSKNLNDINAAARNNHLFTITMAKYRDSGRLESTKLSELINTTILTNIDFTQNQTKHDTHAPLRTKSYICQYCGEKNKSTAIFCKNCGNKIS